LFPDRCLETDQHPFGGDSFVPKCNGKRANRGSQSVHRLIASRRCPLDRTAKTRGTLGQRYCLLKCSTRLFIFQRLLIGGESQRGRLGQALNQPQRCGNGETSAALSSGGSFIDMRRPLRAGVARKRQVLSENDSD
jgi:hypothetical protein